MTRLHDLYNDAGQSPWLDNLKRSWIESGEIQRWVDDGVRGITSNPAIFAKAMMGSEYDEQLQALAGKDFLLARWSPVPEQYSTRICN